MTKPFRMGFSEVDGIMQIGFPADAENSNEAVGDIIRLAKEMGGENPSNRGFEFRENSRANEFYHTANYFLSNRHLKAERLKFAERVDELLEKTGLRGMRAKGAATIYHGNVLSDVFFENDTLDEDTHGAVEKIAQAMGGFWIVERKFEDGKE